MKKVMLMVLAVSLTLSAAFVPVDRAKTVAENQYNHVSSAKTAGNVVRVVENKFEGEITWYAFEFEQGGFVIVSADDAVRPILGYSDRSKFADLDTPGGENFKEWFGNYDKQIAYVRKNSLVDEVGQKTWKDIESNTFSSAKSGNIVVDALVQTEYDQGYPWNLLCPEYVDAEDGNTYTAYVGCVATAMSQVLRYHKWPDVGVGSGSTTYDGSTLSADFTTHNWNYDLMPEVVVSEYGWYPSYWETCSATQAEQDELALQSYWMGLSVSMQYNIDGLGSSGAMSSAVDNAFNDHWKGTSTYSSMATPPAGGPDAQFNTIKAQLDAGRPWYWAGGVHAFILDGYTDDQWYHFNWGWGGSQDGWFHRSFLVPDGTGAGGGDGDYSSGQEGVTYIPNTNPYTSWPAATVNGSVTGENITVTWGSMTGAVEYEVYRTANTEGTPTLVDTVTGTSYTSYNNLPGTYSFHVIVVYASGKSHISNSYSTTIVSDPLLPPARSTKATLDGRTKIDISWAAPAAGLTYVFEDFGNDAGDPMPTGWAYQTASDFIPASGTGKNAVPAVDGGWTGDDGMGTVTHEDDYSGVWADGASFIGYGNFFLISSNGVAETQWLLSPPYTFNSGSYIEWTGRFRYTEDDMVTDSGHRPEFEVVTTTDVNFTTMGSSTTIRDIPHKTHRTCTSGPTGDPGQYLFDQVLTANMPTADGDYARAGFKTTNNPWYSMCWDDIMIGSSIGGGDPPTGYEVYRNDQSIATLGSTVFTLADTGFADGLNSYFVKSLYAGGNESVPSNKSKVYMDANPKPDYLSGIGGTSAQLSWFMPNHPAPQWYRHMDPEDGMSTTALGAAPWLQRKRTVFRAEELGYHYPITIDSVAAVFWDEDEGNWGGVNTFTFRILTGGTGAYDNTIYTSPVQTAVHATMSKHELTSTVQISEDFNLEVYNVVDSDFPSNLVGMRYLEDGSTHSYNWNPDESSYNYGIAWSTGEEPNTVIIAWAEWAFQVYITSSEPSKSKEGWISSTQSSTELIEPIPMKGQPKLINNTFKGGSKGFTYYKIYRDDVEIGTSTTLNYTDNSVPVTGDYTYAVTAVYDAPAGESAYSNEIVLNVQGGTVTPDAPANVVTAIVGSDIRVSWDASTGATSYDVYTSTDPYATTFTLAGNTTNTYYDYTPGTNAKMFFYIKAKN